MPSEQDHDLDAIRHRWAQASGPRQAVLDIVVVLALVDRLRAENQTLRDERRMLALGLKLKGVTQSAETERIYGDALRIRNRVLAEPEPEPRT